MTRPQPSVVEPLGFLAGGGEIASLIRAFDWSTTPLGPAASWSPCLKSTVGMLVRSPVPMALLWGIDGIMIYNDGYSIIAGGRHPGALGSKARESWPEIADFNDNVLRAGLAGKTLTYRDQEMTLHRNGRPEQVWLTLDYSPILNDDDQPAGVLAIVIETTEAVRGRQWLDSERERFRQMFDQAPGFMAMLRGPEHIFDLANPAYLQLVGHRDVLGMSVRAALPDIRDQGFYELLDDVFNSGVAFSGFALPVNLQRTPGAASELRFVDLVYQPVRNPMGEIVGIFVQGTDVTDRVVAETEVRSSEARNRQILDGATDYAIIALDLQGRVTRWNEGARLIFDWTEPEMLGEDISRLLVPEDRAGGRMQLEMRAALETGASNDERWYLRKSGERFWANVEITLLRDDAHHPLGFVRVLRDRTEQYRAAEDLHQAEERLRRAQEAGGVGVFSIDLATQIVHCTPGFCRIFGLDECEFIPSSTIEELVVPDDLPLTSKAVTRESEAGLLDVEYRIHRADTGALRWIARVGEYEADVSGARVRMVGVVQDITERKASQRAIEESAIQFRTFAQALPNHVWTSPPDGQLDWFNDRVYEYSGAHSGELDGANWARIVHPDDRHAAGERWAAALVSGETYETEFRIRRADEVYRWHLVRGVPIRTSDGTIVRWIGTNTDIHERKLAEAKNAQDRDRIWTLSQELMLVCDFEGKISTVNPSATRILGWLDEEMIGRTLSEFLHPEDLERTESEMLKLAHGHTTFALENRYRTKSGDYRVLNWTAVPDGGHIHAVARDITDQRLAEDALRQSQKMEAVGQLTGGIAHDFNNLVQGITGSLELLQSRISQGRITELDRFITGAMTSANRAAALTHRLLAFSRRQPLDPRPVRANPLLASMEDLLRRTIGERIQLELVLAGGLWQTKCDPNQLESAILNLVINARDAMPDGGKLTIETCNAHLDSSYVARQRDVRPGQYVCICATDTGIGMSADIIAKAFEPFFTTKPIGQGTGLGLSMIYGFAQQSEGYAKIYSEVDQGTTVKLYLPRDRSRSEAGDLLPEAPPTSIVQPDETVLIVEDEAVVRGLVAEVLKELGYRALEAADGPAGLEILRSTRRIDLLVTDVGLPGLNGRQLADAGRVLRPDLKVLFMTGYAENAARASGFLEPGMMMITKPFAMDQLTSRIREIINER